MRSERRSNLLCREQGSQAHHVLIALTSPPDAGFHEALSLLQMVVSPTDPAMLLTQVQVQQPDVIVLDAASIHQCSELRRIAPGCGMIMMASHPKEEQMFFAMMYGVRAYLSSATESDTLVETIQRVACGECLISSSILLQQQVAMPVALLRMEPVKTGEENETHSLSRSEVAVLLQILRGKCNKQIALVLGLSETTIKTHITSILKKLLASDRTDAVMIGLERGILSLGERASEPLVEKKPPLSRSERLILIQISRGQSNKQIALVLEISPQTVKNYVTSILKKLSASDRTDAVVIGLELGIITLQERVSGGQLRASLSVIGHLRGVAI